MFLGLFFLKTAGTEYLLVCFREDRVRSRMENFRQTRERNREEREEERAEGRSRQTRMEDFFRVTRKREQVSST